MTMRVHMNVCVCVCDCDPTIGTNFFLLFFLSIEIKIVINMQTTYVNKNIEEAKEEDEEEEKYY